MQPAETSVLTDESTVRAFTVPGTPRGLVGEQQCFITAVHGVLIGTVIEVVDVEPGQRAVAKSLSTGYDCLSTTSLQPSDIGCLLTVEWRVGQRTVPLEQTETSLRENASRYLARVKTLLEAGVAPPIL